MAVIPLGQVTAGEIPPPLVHTFEDGAGNPLDLTGCTATFTTRQPSGATVVKSPGNVTVSADQSAHKGEVTVTWTTADGDFAWPGAYYGELWAAAPSDAFRYAAGFAWTAGEPVASPTI